MKTPDIVLQAQHIAKVYERGAEEVLALNDISLQVRKGEFLAFVGPSGSGKTTLVNILGCLDNPTSGRLSVAGKPVFSEDRNLREGELTRIRRQVFGYVFQRFYLVPTLTVLENVQLPFAFFRKPGRVEDPLKVLRFLGLDKRLDHTPGELSGGEMQRVAIARALMNNPEILLADEPTGNLDTQRSREIGDILCRLNTRQGLTILLVTHNLELARLAQRVVELRDGKIVHGRPRRASLRRGRASS